MLIFLIILYQIHNHLVEIGSQNIQNDSKRNCPTCPIKIKFTKNQWEQTFTIKDKIIILLKTCVTTLEI